MSSLYVDTIRNRDGNGAPVFDKGIVLSGVITASGALSGEAVSIGATEVISGAFELKNIAGLDTTTTATIESAIANAPNDFTSLNVSGIATFGSNIDLNADIDIFGHAEINTLNASGILTASTLTTGAEASAIRISSNTISGPATLTIDPAGIGTNTGTVVIQGDLQVEGDTTTINSTTLTVDDKNIILASGSLTDASSDGGGITLESGEGNKTFNWVDATDSWTSSENIDLASNKTFKINTTNVLSSDSLGAGVTNSSLENVGTLAGLNVSGVTTFASNLDINDASIDVSGNINCATVNVSGASTFTGVVTLSDVDITGQLDVQGTSELTNVNVDGFTTITGGTSLANVSISGVTTFTDLLDINNASIDVTGNINAATLRAGISTFTGDIDVDGHTNLDNVNVSGAITATTFTGNLEGTVNTASQTNITSVGTLTGLTVSGNITAQTDLDVDGHTNLDNVSIAGVTTHFNLLDLNNASLNVTGNISGTTINVSGVSTLSGNITAQADLDVDGHTELDNVNISGVTTVGLTTVLQTGILTHDLNVSGVSTFRGDIRLTEQDGAGIYFGEGLDFGIVHNGANSYVFDRGGTGNVYIAGSNEVIIADASGSGPNASDYVTETKARFVTNGPVRLYYDNVEKFATAGSGATVYGTFTADTLSITGISTFTGDIDVDGHTNLDNVSIAGVVTATTFVGDGDFVELDVDGHTNLDNVSVAGVITATTFVGDGDFVELDVDGHTNLDNVSISGITTFAGFVYDELDSDTNLRNGGDFNNITGVAWTGGVTDTLYWDFATAPSVIGGEADNGIGTIELANLPTSFQYSTRATLITFTDGANDWNEGSVVVKVNGQTPTNILWRNGAQPVGTVTGAANHFDIVEFKIVHDTNSEFSVFAEWQAYHDPT